MSDSRGRHTTTNRELLELPGGGLLIDTPGMREMQLWEGSLEDAFADIHALAAGCHFRDCRHTTEPRCAVATAAENGVLDPARLASFRRLQRELDAQARRQDELLMLQDKKKNKVLHKAMKHIKIRPYSGRGRRRSPPPGTPASVTHTLNFDTSIAYV